MSPLSAHPLRPSGPLAVALEVVRLVVCEDDAELRGILLSGLPHFGIDARGVPDGVALNQVLVAHRPTVVVLDIGLPGEDGLSIARRLRAQSPTPLGIILLTARGSLEDRLEGLKDGADVYFVKPVDLRELAFAVRNLHRRVSPVVQEAATADTYTLDSLHSQLRLPTGEQVPLTATELRILQTLAKTPGEVVERVDLLRSLQLPMDLPGMQRLETQISRLRSKVRKESGAQPLPLHARHGVGYAFLGNLRTHS
ncbi:MAG: response regulator transcription factor [Betaproteobacteria bacterium]